MKGFTRFLAFVLVLCFVSSTAWAQVSAIASGKWIQLKIVKQGVYRLNASDLSAAGFDLNGINSDNFQLRGHQCGMLPEKNGTHTAGLPEIPIWVVDGNDGKLDASDYILFYAGSPVKWTYDSISQAFEHSLNIYTDEGYLYFGVGSSKGLRLANAAEITSAPQQTISKTMWLGLYEKELSNPANMGRTWLGEKLGNEALFKDFTFNFPGDSDDSAFVKVSYAGAMYSEVGSVRLKLNGRIFDQSFSPLNAEYESFRLSNKSAWIKTPARQLLLSLELTRPNTQSAAWLDFVEMNTYQPIAASVEPQILRHPAYAANGVIETQIPLGNLSVWDVGNEMTPSVMKVNSGGGYQYFRSQRNNDNPAYVVFDKDYCLKPEITGPVLNANVLSGASADLIIITHPDFTKAAEDLAAFRRSNDGLVVKIVTPNDIYKEFSAGQQDVVAIRDYLRAEYQKSLQTPNVLKYVLLMGTTSYDPKGRVSPNTNFIPIYHFDSYVKSQTFCLDDFIGYLDSTNGDPANGTSQMLVSVGRIPCRTLAEANGVVNKLKRYASKDALGPWRTELTFVCDDVDDDWEKQFVQESEKYTVKIDNIYPDLRVNKIYADAYKQQSTGNTEKYPDVNAAIDLTMNNGALFVNYQGHGGEKGWAQEGILDVPMINAWKNPYKMPVLFTATCEFSRFDDPSLQSGGELSLLNPSGGAIALMTTTRLVFVSGNSAINNDFWTNYGFPKPNEENPTLGLTYQRMKNRPAKTSEDTKFALLGDPSMKLAFPEHHIVLDSINGKTSVNFTDTLKAFEVVKIKGHVEKRTGGKFSDFNGNLWVKVFDKPQVRYTLDNDNHNAKLPFADQTSFIYKGQVTVVDGNFVIIFSIPKDIAYNIANGKMFMYAHNGVTDASGAVKMLIGGSLSNVTPDTKGPVVKLYMNDSTFKYGGKVNPEAIFLAKIYDESGINATGAGIGRDMIATLDPGTENEKSFILNDYFGYELNSYTQGLVQYPMSNLSTGSHTIRFKVWDIHNNSTQAELAFVVLDKNEFAIEENYPVPNPFREEVNLVFVHNLANKNMDAHVEIVDFGGRVLARFEQHIESANSKENRLHWDGKNGNGTFVGPGMYMYKVVLITEDGKKASFSGQLIKTSN